MTYKRTVVVKSAVCHDSLKLSTKILNSEFNLKKKL